MKNWVIKKLNWYWDTDDFILLEIWNIFETKQEAEKELGKRKALAKIKKWIWENKIENIIWEIKYWEYFVIRRKYNKIVVHNTYLLFHNDFIFNTRYWAEKCLEECKEQWEILFDLK